MAVAEADAVRSDALRVGMAIATGIGLHNFSEGLAIGQAAHSGSVSLALLLVIGFALHNGTEGFGIVGPLAATGQRASWGWLAAAGLIGGGPTFLGTLVGTAVSSDLLFVGFLALAAGAILYVIGELFGAGRRLSWEVTLWGVFAGFGLGLLTELVLVAAGA
jgi:ZIP family zinc transporter